MNMFKGGLNALNKMFLGIMIVIMTGFINNTYSQKIISKSGGGTKDTQVLCGFDHLHKNVRPVDYTMNHGRSNDEILTIPVVVHIIHKGEPLGQGTNISDDQVFSAINEMNLDYRKVPGSNGDGDGVDVGVEFCLAARTPNGESTNGINRVDGTVIPLYEDEGITAGQGEGANEMDIKNLSRWPNNQYYNIWVVSEIENNDGGAGIQGYAYFPTSNPVDGTVILYNAFGTVGNLKLYTNMNRTLTHELGHGLNLYHTFQGQSCTETNCETQGDRVCDTPPTTLNSNCNNPACNGTQLVENYMDYTSQTCKDMFTQGQKDRMRAAIIGARSDLLESLACVPVSSLDISVTDIAYPTGNICEPSYEPELTIVNYGSNEVTSMLISYGVENNILEYNWTGSLITGETETLTLPIFNGSVNDNEFVVTVSEPNGLIDVVGENNTMLSQYSVINGNQINVNIVQDFYGQEITWDIKNENDEIVSSGGPYEYGSLGNEYNYTLCIPDGCYSFTIYDSAGDGICCSYGLGSYTVTDVNGVILAEGGGSFNFSEDFAEQVTGFCTEDSPYVDCNGQINGTAYIDSCGTCVGGWTFLNPCTPDCNEDYNNLNGAFIDVCGDCVGGETGIDPCESPCEGDYCNNPIELPLCEVVEFNNYDCDTTYTPIFPYPNGLTAARTTHYNSKHFKFTIENEGNYNVTILSNYSHPEATTGTNGVNSGLSWSLISGSDCSDYVSIGNNSSWSTSMNSGYWVQEPTGTWSDEYDPTLQNHINTMYFTPGEYIFILSGFTGSWGVSTGEGTIEICPVNQPTCGDNNNMNIIENPFSGDECIAPGWGTDVYPWTVGYPCILNASYYHKTIEVPAGQILTSITLNACELNLLDEFGNLRSTYDNYFWFDGDCFTDDQELMPGVVIYNNLGESVYYINRHQMALDLIDDGVMTLDNLNLSFDDSPYEIMIIHDEEEELGWSQTIFYDFFNFGDCFEANGFVFGQIWLSNTTVGDGYNGPEIIIESVDITYLNIIINSIGVSPVSDKHPVYNVFPNPTNKSITITSDTKERVTGIIYSLYGKIMDVIVIDNNTTIDLYDYSPGIYILNINKTEVIKIVKW